MALAALAPARADALPILRLFLDGDVERMGSGGAAVFRSARAEALRLERPALLATQERPALRLSLENEAIVTLEEGKYAGTAVHDRKLRLTALLPLGPLTGEIPTTLFVGVRRETARIHLATEEDGVILDSIEARDAVEVGVATALPWGLSLAGSIGTNAEGAPSWLLETRYRPTPLVEAWFRRRSASWDYDITVPDGVARKVRSPAVRYRIDDTQSESELGLEVGRRDVAWATGGFVFESPHDLWLEAGTRPVPWLALRAGADRERFAFDDSMQAEGTGTIARVDLALERERLYGGIDADAGAGKVIARYVHSDLSGASHGEEVGTAAAQAFLQVDYDMGLFFRGGYRLEGHQWALGWDQHRHEGVGFAFGAQFFRLILHPADFSIQSNTLQRALAAEESQQARADLLGLTGALYVPVGRFRLSTAVGQYLPLSTRQEGVAPTPQPQPSPRPAPPARPRRDEGPYEWLTTAVGDALDKLSRYGGGNRLLFEISTEF